MTLMDIVCESLKPLGDTESQAQFDTSRLLLLYTLLRLTLRGATVRQRTFQRR